MSPSPFNGDNLIGNHTARLIEFKEETYTRGEHETRLCENRMRGEGELHTKAEQRISTIEHEEEKLENTARREAWRMVSRLKEDSESRIWGSSDDKRNLEEGRFKATGKKVRRSPVGFRRDWELRSGGGEAS